MKNGPMFGAIFLCGFYLSIKKPPEEAVFLAAALSGGGRRRRERDRVKARLRWQRELLQRLR